MALGDIITFYDGASWLNRVEGSDETFGRHDDKTTAATAGMARASVAHVRHHIEHESEYESGHESAEGSLREVETSEMKNA